MSFVGQFFKGFKDGMKDFGHSLGGVINTVLLLVVYIVGVGITSIVSKLLFKKKFLNIENAQKKETYWSDLKLTQDSESYYQQF